MRPEGNCEDAAHSKPLPEAQRAEEELQAQLSLVGSWDSFNILQVHQLSHGQPLLVVAPAVFRALGLIQALQLPEDKLCSFVQALELAQPHNFYHNSTHIADVCQALCAVLLEEEELNSSLTNLERLAVVFSALIHDTGHPGVSNDFLVRTAMPEAITYSDRNVNEMAHLARAFRLLLQPQHNFLDHFPPEEFAAFRKLVIECVLATDSEEHSRLLQAYGAAVDSHGSTPVSCWPPAARTVLLQLLLHLMDISNTLKSTPLAVYWAERITDEFHQQGDRERQLGLPISSLCDRACVDIPSSQTGFVNYMVLPCLEQLRCVAPLAMARLHGHGKRNLQFWSAMKARGEKELQPDHCRGQ